MRRLASLLVLGSTLTVMTLAPACGDSSGTDGGVIPGGDADGGGSAADSGGRVDVLPGEPCTTDAQCAERMGDLDSCVVAVCDPRTARCAAGVAKDYTACDDGDPCTLATECRDGTCGGGFARGCDDGDPCTEDTCAADGTCAHAPLAAGPCDDGDPCSEDDACVAGVCAGTPSGTCVCETTHDCAPYDEDRCDGALVCGDDGLCHAVPGSRVVCDTTGDGPCERTACDPATGACVAAAVADGTDCDDGNHCTRDDACRAGACEGADDCGACAADADCAPFDDDDRCNGTLACREGTCRVAPETVVRCAVAADGPCERTACVAATGACERQARPDGTWCSDGDVCTAGDRCDGGACGAGGALDCDDGEPCTSDTCAAATGCEYAPADGACDDGDPCTDGDTCADGACAGGAATDCDDGDPCTADACDPAAGCTHARRTEDPLCACTTAADCDDANDCTAATCDPAGTCRFTPVADDTLCADDDACTVEEACVAGACVGATRDCEDGDLCTADTCDAVGGCAHAPIAGCQCGGDDDCPDGPCTTGVCNPTTLRCDAVPLDPGVLCDDADACTEGTACDGEGGCGGGTPADCSDAFACTIDFCRPADGCQHSAGGCECDPAAAGGCDDDNACTTDACVDYDCTHTALPDGDPCPDDGDPCTAGHTCQGGACAFADYTCPEADCGDGADDDYDGATDCDDGDCAEGPLCTELDCTDGLDSDRDGATDCADGDCAAAPPCNPEADCDNGVDDDEDGDTDCDDASCAVAVNCVPEPNCHDDLDNDLDGDTDCADGDCVGRPDCLPESACGDGIDDDFDGDTDCDDLDCAADRRCLPETDCTDGADDDLDGATDCDDSDCLPDPACTEQACLDGRDDDADGATDCADPDCAELADCRECTPVDTVACGGTVTGTTVGGDRVAAQYPGCTKGTIAFAGPEHVVAFTPPVSGLATLALIAQFNGAIVVMERACRPGTSCAGSADAAHGIESLPLEVVGGTTYYAVVDGVGFGDQGTFELTVDCPQLVEDCRNGADDDGDGLVDCADPGCGTSPACKELVCDDEVDNDGDGSVDCADADCAATFLCASCAVRQTLSCGSVVDGTTAGAGNLLDRYPACTPTIYSGPEHVYAFTPPYDLDAIITLDPAGYDGAILVLEGECSAADACFARADAAFVGGTETLATELRGGVTYFIVAEGFASFSAGAYGLSIECSGAPEACDNGVDDDDDGFGDCLDDECEGQLCDDGDACTHGDVCSLGDCLAPFDVSCDDGNDCTDDSCAPATGCAYAPALAGSPCDVPVLGVCDELGVCQQRAAPGDVVISEIMKDPACAADTTGEWVELFNAGERAVDLYGWTLSSGADPGHTIRAHVAVPPLGLVLLCGSADPAANGGVTGCAHAWGEDLALSNDGTDSLTLSDPMGAVIDAVTWDDATFPDEAGAALNLDPVALDAAANDDGASWCAATAPFGPCEAPDRGTPRAPNAVCGGTWCELGETIACGQTVTGDTSGLPDVLGGYACTGRAQTGGERVFAFTAPERLRVAVSLAPEEGVDLDLNVLRSSCDPLDCTGFADETLEFTANPATYYFVVDGFGGARGTFELTLGCDALSVENCGNQMDDDDDGLVDCDDLDCDEDPFCTEFCDPLETALRCDRVSAGTTVGRPNDITTYACAGALLNGGEAAWPFVAEADGEVTFTLSYAAAPFLDLFVLEGTCGDTTCVAEGDRAVTLQVTAGRTYYVVVDGRSGTVGDFALATDCAGGVVVETVCDDGADDDGDGQPDCTDADCRYHPFCHERTCDDGEDEDGDTLVDCADPDCAQSRACNACVDAVPIACGQFLAGDTLGRSDRLDGYACAPWDESGGERVFSFVATGTGTVTATLDDATGGDLDVFVLGQACQPSVCRAHGADGATFQATLGQTYYVVVDGAAGAAGAFELGLVCDLAPPEVCTGGVDEDEDGDVDCDDPDCVGRPGCAEVLCRDGADDEGDGLVDCADPDCVVSRQCNACAEAVELVCGDLALGTTLGVTDGLTHYDCADWDETGGEVVYRFHPPQTVDVTLDLAGFEVDLDVLVLDGDCSGAGCIARGVQGAYFTALAGRDYFIVVDGFEGAAGAFQLGVACAGVTETCGDGRDNDGDGDTDCADSDCSANPACPEICDDGVDNDGDDRADCADADCDAAPNCAELCQTDATVTCGQTFTGTTAGQPNEVNNWQGCAILTATGGEAAHALGVPGPRTVTAQLSSAVEGLSLFATSQACSDRRCVAYDRGTGAVTFEALPGESYWLVVDGRLGAAGGYQLSVSCLAEAEDACGDGLDEDADGATDCADDDCDADPACACAPTGVIACGGTVTGDTTGAAALWDAYPACGEGWSEPGAEHVYAFTTETAAEVTVSSPSAAAVDLFVLEDTCNAPFCLAAEDDGTGASNTLTFSALAGTTYYLVVDGTAAGGQAYELSVDCP